MHSPVRSGGRYELKRRYFHRGYLWPWIFVILVPFVLRFVMFYDISFPFQSSPSSIPVTVRPTELIELYERARDSLGSSPPAPVIRPNEDAWITFWKNYHGKSPMTKTGIEMSKEGPMKRSEIETSKGRDHTLTMRPNGQDLTDGSFVLPEEKEDILKVADVADSQLRAIGERINAIKRFHGQKDNAEEMREMSRLKNGKDQRKAEGKERANDDQGRIYILKQGLDEKLTAEDEAEKNAAEKEERAAEDEMAAAEADEDRVFAKVLEADEQMLVAEDKMAAAEADEDRVFAKVLEADDLTAEEANNQRRPAEETEAEERRFAKELEIAEEREEAAKEREVAEQIEVDEEKRFAENTEADRRAAKGTEAEEETAVAKERDSDEHGRAGEEMRAVEERKAANEREADEVRKAAQKTESDDEQEATVEERNSTQGQSSEMESKADDQGEAGEKKAAQDREVAEQRKAAHGKQTAEDGMKVDEEGETGTDVEGEEEMSASDKTKEDETNNEGQKQSQQQDVEDKNLNDEQKVVNDHKEDGAIKLDQSREESKDIEDHIPVDEKEKEEEKHEESDPNFGEDVPSSKDQIDGESLTAIECDLFDGDWEFDPEGPMYTNSTCFFIRGDHNCMSNGRPDTGYQNWRWKPRGCDLSRFDARAFMEAFRGKTIGYVGDSLARNQMQSMLCLLSLVEIPVLLHEDALTARWCYEQHNVTLAAVWSPYLLKESQEGILGFENGQSVLYLDVLDPVWTEALPHLDVIVFSVGQWYFKSSVYIMHDEIIGCHYCPQLNLTEIGFVQAYSIGLRSALEKVGNADWNGTAIVSTYAIGHGEKRESGEEGDECRREGPLEKEQFESTFQGMHDEMRDIVLAEFNSMTVDAENKLNKSEAHLHFLDVTKLSLLRADGHPGPFHRANPFEGKTPGEMVFNDCLHWCLPGPVDTWNQLLVKVMDKQL